MEYKKLFEESNRYIMNTYKRYPVVLRKGRGMKVWSSDGKEYLDFVAGVAVNILGHCNPRVVVAIQKQAQRLIHISNYYHIEPQIKLAKLLVEHSFADKVFFCNSGAEANEAAIKLARKYAKENYSYEKYHIIAAKNSFHGRTFGAMSATGQEKFQAGFEPLVPGFDYVEFNDIENLKKTITNNTCAVILEPIQGEGGVRMPDKNYLKEVKNLCKNYNALLILDEVQTGMGRTGKLFAYEHFDVVPDIMTIAKGLGNGVPIGAMLTTDEIASAFKPGNHATTFGGNPLVCAAAVATIETLLEDGFILDQCNRMSKYFFEKLEQLKAEFPYFIKEIRGIGLIIGVELTRECDTIVNACLNKGILINCTMGNVLRFVPPLIIQRKDIDLLVEVLRDILSKLT
ncbi:MAG: acetylornithine transaminase [Nitrospirae bacterium]|nr:acetylornithine transaminase [Nitrospirota bacterium]